MSSWIMTTITQESCHWVVHGTWKR